MITVDSVTRVGDTGLLVRVPDARHADVLATGLRARCPGLTDVVPAADTVLVVSDDPSEFWLGLEATIRSIAGVLPLPATNESARAHVVPVVYDGPDLPEVADMLDMSVEQVVARHTGSKLTVEHLGFAPGFPYLRGLDPALTVPRLDTPRVRIPADAIGLAGGATCVYPTVSPGGWRLIGHTDMVLFDPERDRPALFAAGDAVQFVEVDR